MYFFLSILAIFMDQKQKLHSQQQISAGWFFVVTKPWPNHSATCCAQTLTLLSGFNNDFQLEGDGGCASMMRWNDKGDGKTLKLKKKKKDFTNHFVWVTKKSCWVWFIVAWPSQSPDLNPTRNWCECMNTDVLRCSPTNLNVRLLHRRTSQRQKKRDRASQEPS